MIRILHYIPSLDRASGGTTAYLQLLALGLGRLVDLHIATHPSAHPVAVEGARVHFISGRLPGGMRREWLALLERLRPAVVHVNCCWVPGPALAQRWAQEAGYKVVLTPHGMLEPWILRRHYWTRKLPALLLYQRRAVERADRLHATAASERDHLLALGWNGQVRTVANGIDVRNVQMKTCWEWQREMLFLSRVHVKKGINFLLEAVAQLRAQLEGWTVRIAGEGEASYVAELRARAEQLGIGGMVRFEGGVYGERKWELMRRADVFVLPTHSENFGIVVAEALACGTPVVTTVGAPWEELRSERCGWQTGIGTEPLVEALRAFLACSPGQLQEMGERGRRLVEERYSVEGVAAQLLRVYEELL